MKRSNSVVNVQQDGSILRIEVIGGGVVEFDTRKVHEDNVQRAIMHGFKQRLSDAAALSRNPDNGAPATPAEKYAEIPQGCPHVSAEVREGSGGHDRHPGRTGDERHGCR